jgi:nitrate/nitrite-specific signal transduction histidine kinase
MGLQQRASLYSGLGLLFLVGILVFIGVWVVRDTTDRSLNERVAVAQMVSRGVDQALQSAQDELATLAALVDLDDGDPAPEQQALTNLLAFSGTLNHIFLMDVSGAVVASNPLPVSPGLQELIDSDSGVSLVLTGSPSVITSISMPAPGSQPMFSISMPVADEAGSMSGVVTGHMDLGRFLGGFFQPLGLGSTAYMEVINEEGRVMARSGERPTFSLETDYAAHFASLIVAGEATMGECFGCHDDGENNIDRTRQVLAFAPLSTVPGGVAIRQNEAEALAPSRQLLRYMLMAGSPLLILGLVFTWTSTRMVVRPVLELTAASRRITQGDLNVPITISRSDELGQLAQTFDQMRVGLRESLTQMEDRARESEQRARHLAALNAVAATASRSLDLRQALSDSLEQVLTFLTVRSGCVYLRENGGTQLRLEACSEMTDEAMSIIPTTADGIGETGVVFYDRVTGDDSVALVRVPLVSQARSLGEMWLIGPGPRRFTTEETDLLASIGRQVGVAIHNARLFQDSGRRESEAQALRRLGLEVSRLLDLDRILTTVVDSTVQLLRSEGAIVALHDDASGQVYVTAVSGALPREFGTLRLELSEDSLIGKAVRSGNPQSTTDYLNDDTLSHGLTLDNLLRKGDLRACLVVPVSVGERVGGVLMAVFRRRQSFLPEETDLLLQLASQAAVALENARLHDQVQELAIMEERARLSREMHDSIGQALAYAGLETDEIARLLEAGEHDQALVKIAEVRKGIRETSEEVRDAILALRTPLPHEVELPKMLAQYLDSFRRQARVDVTLDIRDEAATRFSPRTALELVRVVQEALSNVRKHSGAVQARVTFEGQDGQAVICIDDDGVGFDMSDVYSEGQHFGVQVMKERMVALGGSLDIDSRPGQGTRVTAKLPLEDGGGE